MTTNMWYTVCGYDGNNNVVCYVKAGSLEEAVEKFIENSPDNGNMSPDFVFEGRLDNLIEATHVVEIRG